MLAGAEAAEFVEPVEDDVEFGRVGIGAGGFDHQESFAVGSDAGEGAVEIEQFLGYAGADLGSGDLNGHGHEGAGG